VVQQVQVGNPIEYLDVPEFLSHWGADANAVTQAVRRIGKLE